MAFPGFPTDILYHHLFPLLVTNIPLGKVMPVCQALRKLATESDTRRTLEAVFGHRASRAAGPFVSVDHIMPGQDAYAHVEMVRICKNGNGGDDGNGWQWSNYYYHHNLTIPGWRQLDSFHPDEFARLSVHYDKIDARHGFRGDSLTEEAIFSRQRLATTAAQISATLVHVLSDTHVRDNTIVLHLYTRIIEMNGELDPYSLSGIIPRHYPEMVSDLPLPKSTVKMQLQRDNVIHGILQPKKGWKVNVLYHTYSAGDLRGWFKPVQSCTITAHQQCQVNNKDQRLAKGWRWAWGTLHTIAVAMLRFVKLVS